MRNNAQKLFDNVGYDYRMLRPYTLKEDGYKNTFVDIGGTRVNAKDTGIPFLMNATGLPVESWKAIDDEVMGYQTNYRSAFNDVKNAGLTKQVSEYSLTFTSQKMGGTEDAVRDMDGLANRSVDSPNFDVDVLPMFVTHKDFEISWRKKGAFGANVYDKGGLGISWDSSMIEEGIDKIERMHEKVIFEGWSIPYGGNYVYGYTNFAERNQVDLSYDWAASTTTSAQIFADFKSLWEECTINNFQPMDKIKVYIHPSVAERFVDDYKDNYAKTLKARCMELEGIESISVSSYVPSAQDVVMVRMASSSVRIIQGTPNIVPVMWYDNAGMMDKLTLMSIQEPQLRADLDGNTSITHGKYSKD